LTAPLDPPQQEGNGVFPSEKGSSNIGSDDSVSFLNKRRSAARQPVTANAQMTPGL